MAIYADINLNTNLVVRVDPEPFPIALPNYIIEIEVSETYPLVAVGWEYKPLTGELLPASGFFTSWTPVLLADSVGGEDNPTLGTDSIQWGTYARLGNFVVAHYHIQFGTSGIAVGGTAYRISTPTQVHQEWFTHNMQVGMGHIHNANGGFLGLGPGAFRHVLLHVAPTLASRGNLAGLVLGGQPKAALPTYTFTNLAADRAFDANAHDADTTVTQVRAGVAELYDTLGTFIGDYKAQLDVSGIDDVGASIPWAWEASDWLIGMMFYREAGA